MILSILLKIVEILSSKGIFCLLQFLMFLLVLMDGFYAFEMYSESTAANSFWQIGWKLPGSEHSQTF